MEKLSGYWVDKNGNRWDCIHHTMELAIKYSLSMIQCNNCTNCKYCRHCVNCKSCSNCNNCGYCVNCDKCVCCFNCKNYRCNPKRMSLSIIDKLFTGTIYWTSKYDVQITERNYGMTLLDFEKKINKDCKDKNILKEMHLNCILKLKQIIDL